MTTQTTQKIRIAFREYVVDLDSAGAVELDMNVPHGAVAVKPKAKPTARPQEAPTTAISKEELQDILRVSGAIEIEPSTQPEQEAPYFRAVSFDGKMVDLESLHGKKIWLIFYRYATCPLCNVHLKEIYERHTVLKNAGVEIIAIFESAVPQFYHPGGIANPYFPVVSDPEKKLYRLYHTKKNLLGVLHPSVAMGLVKAIRSGFSQGKIEGEFAQMPAHFLIDETGQIRTAHHNKTIIDHISWAAVGSFANIPIKDLRPPSK